MTTWAGKDVPGRYADTFERYVRDLATIEDVLGQPQSLVRRAVSRFRDRELAMAAIDDDARSGWLAGGEPHAIRMAVLSRLGLPALERTSLEAAAERAEVRHRKLEQEAVERFRASMTAELDRRNRPTPADPTTIPTRNAWTDPTMTLSEARRRRTGR